MTIFLWARDLCLPGDAESIPQGLKPGSLYASVDAGVETPAYPSEAFVLREFGPASIAIAGMKVGHLREADSLRE